MAKSISAIVTPEVLTWARNLDGITVTEVAERLNVSEQKIIDWENGIKQPTLTQAKNLAKYYKVPFVYFYLPGIPIKTKRIEKVDYRTFGNGGALLEQSRELSWFLRDIEERRDTMLMLYKECGKTAAEFPLVLNMESDDSEIASKIRNLLCLNSENQKKFRKPEEAYKHCVNVLENYDVLVFQAAKINPSEMRGLSLAYNTMPVIATNRKDEYAARLFTLCHEIVHIVTRTSGICNDVSDASISAYDIEMKCNRISGLILIPEDEIKKHNAISKIKTYGFDDIFVCEIARDFAVSKEVVLHRLWDINVIDRKLYFETVKRYNDEYINYKSNNKPKGFPPPTIDIGSQVGKLYSKTVLSAYYAERITTRDTSNYLLNLKSKNFSKLERWCF